MILKLRQRMAQEESGFTLVELLVVMLILGLLAAIAIPAFFNQRDKARDASAKEAVRTAETAMETYATDHDGSYASATAGTTTSDLNKIEASLNDVGANLSVTSNATTYTVTVDSENTPNTFSISRDANGVTTLTCDTDGNDGCPSDGTWG